MCMYQYRISLFNNNMNTPKLSLFYCLTINKLISIVFFHYGTYPKTGKQNKLKIIFPFNTLIHFLSLSILFFFFSFFFFSFLFSSFSPFSLPFFMKSSFKFFPVFHFGQKLPPPPGGGNGQNIYPCDITSNVGVEYLEDETLPTGWRCQRIESTIYYFSPVG